MIVDFSQERAGRGSNKIVVLLQGNILSHRYYLLVPFNIYEFESSDIVYKQKTQLIYVIHVIGCRAGPKQGEGFLVHVVSRLCLIQNTARYIISWSKLIIKTMVQVISKHTEQAKIKNIAY